MRRIPRTFPTDRVSPYDKVPISVVDQGWNAAICTSSARLGYTAVTLQYLPVGVELEVLGRLLLVLFLVDVDRLIRQPEQVQDEGDLPAYAYTQLVKSPRKFRREAVYQPLVATG
jgi:hypothetical protein